MGEYVVKAARDVDLYLIWSTVTDSAHYIGTRDEIREFRWAQYKADHPNCDPRDGFSPDDSMRRADETGTSAIAPAGVYGWDDEAFHVGEAAPHQPGWWFEIPRADLVAYAEALIADDEAAAHALLRRTPLSRMC